MSKLTPRIKVKNAPAKDELVAMSQYFRIRCNMSGCTVQLDSDSPSSLIIRALKKGWVLSPNDGEFYCKEHRGEIYHVTTEE